MDDVWFGSNLARRDVDTAVRALSLQGDRLPPLIAVSESGARLVLASRVFFGVFGVDDGEALASRLLAGRDPGARRLSVLCQSLALNGAPRLERLRFSIGPSSEVITFLCRRVLAEDQQPIFVAAALGLRSAEIPDGPVVPRPVVDEADDPQAPAALVEPAPAPAAPGSVATAQPDIAVTEPVPPLAPPLPPEAMTVQAIQATLRTRWPAKRSIRFLWQTDGDFVCTQVTAPLADVVGPANAALLGHNLRDVARQLDPSGRFAEALASKATWSGIDVAWPIEDARAAVEIGLGAIPAYVHDQIFEGFRGYGVIRLDRVIVHGGSSIFTPADTPVPRANNVVTFPGLAKTLSAEDHAAFTAVGVELRDQVGPLDATLAAEPSPIAHTAGPAEPLPDSVPAAPPVSSNAVAEPTEMIDANAVSSEGPSPPEAAPHLPVHDRTFEVGANGLAVLDRLSIALLVSRDNVPIFANRHLLNLTGFSNEDALHAAGGLAHLFGDVPGNASGAEAIGLRGRDGTIIPAIARVQRIEWNGLAATLLTLRPEARSLPLAERVREMTRQPDAAPQEFAALGPSSGNDAEWRDMRALVETLPDGLAVIDAGGTVCSMNRSGEALLGCDRRELVGRSFLGLFAPDMLGPASDYFDCIKSSVTQSPLNDGREILVKSRQTTIPVFMTLGRLGREESEQGAGDERFYAVFRDLTPWKKVEHDLAAARDAAERASALKSDFLAKVSHEVRTPLNAIIGFADVMHEERFGPLADRYKGYASDIHASGTHVLGLVNDLLDLSKIEAGKMELALDPLDVNRVVSDCVSMMQPQANRDRIIVRLSLAAHLPQIEADGRSLTQIVLNILSNAVKYNEPGGQVIVATALTEGGHVVIRIRDTGPGMADPDIAVALEPFRQLAGAQTASPETGLGLPLTKALVEANEATFSIRSKVGQGTLVEVSFPPSRVLGSRERPREASRDRA